MSNVVLVVPTELTTTGKLSRDFLDFCINKADPAALVANLTGINYGVIWFDPAGWRELYYLNTQAHAFTSHKAPDLDECLFAQLPHELYLLIDPSILEIVADLLMKCGHHADTVHIPGPLSTS